MTFIILAVVIVLVAIGNVLTAHANYRTHCNLVRALELQQNFNDCVVDFEQSVCKYLLRRDGVKL